MRSVVAPLLFASLAACTSSRSASPSPVESTTQAERSAEALPFIEDDYGRAISEARQKKLPVFIDVWAPW